MADADASQGRLAAGAPRSATTVDNGRFVRSRQLEVVSAETGIPDGVGVEVMARDRFRRRVLALADIASAGLGLLVAVMILGVGDHLRLWTLAALPLIVVI